jgi:large repetitive protein
MVWSGASMTVERNVARVAAAVLAMLVVLVMGSTGVAMATAPNVAIDAPLAGSSTNNQTPPFSGTTDDVLDPVTLHVYAGTDTTGSPVQTLVDLAPLEIAPAEATWATAPESLEPGQYTAVAEQTNAEPETGQSPAVTFTIDTAAPAVSIDPVVSPTKDPTPTLTGGAGTAPGDASTVAVKVYEGNSVSGSPVRTVGGTVSGSTWTAGPVASLADGTYTAQVSQSDVAGNTGKSAAVTFTVDTTPPVVSVTAPTAGAVLNSSKPTVSGLAGQASGDDPSVTLKLYAGSTISGSPIQTHEVTPSAASWTTGAVTALGDGTYTVRAEQSDAAGNTGTSTAVTFTIDTTSPVVSLGSVLSPTKDSTPTLTGGAGTAVGDDATVTVTLYEGGSVGGAVAATKSVSVSGGGWSYTAPTLADGTYTAQVSQSDVAGNTGKSAAVTFTVDTTPPVVSVTAPTAGAVLNSSKPTVSGLAGQASGDDPSVTLKLYAGSTISGSPIQTHEVTPSGGSWTTGAIAALADGTYTVQAAQSDAAGNTGKSAAVTFTIDTSLPAVTLTSPAPGSSTSTEFEALSGAAGTSERDLPQITVKLFAGSQVTSEVPLQEVTVRAVSGQWSAAFGGLSPGTYTAQAQQSNNLGRTGFSEPVTFMVKAPTVVTPPSEPKPTATTTTTTPPPSPPMASFQWFPATPHVGERVTLVSTSTDSTGPITGFAWAAAGDGVFVAGSATLTTSFAAPGSHVVLLRVTGASGVSSSVAETIPVTLPEATLMQPFPVVRIAGSETASGVRVGLLTVQAPMGATVNVTCHGSGCPIRAQSMLATPGKGKSKIKAGVVTVVLQRFERSLRAGVVLEIRVSKPGQIGKYTRFTVRHGKLPTRADMCLGPAGVKPIACPSS